VTTYLCNQHKPVVSCERLRNPQSDENSKQHSNVSKTQEYNANGYEFKSIVVGRLIHHFDSQLSGVIESNSTEQKYNIPSTKGDAGNLRTAIDPGERPPLSAQLRLNPPRGAS
jgi:hypothetical protein